MYMRQPVNSDYRRCAVDSEPTEAGTSSSRLDNHNVGEVDEDEFYMLRGIA